jgi:hypothetical protein
VASVQKLRTLVQKTETRSTAAPRGRVAAADVIKAIEGCLRLLRDEETGKVLFRRADVTDLTEEQWERANAAFKILAKRVAALRRMFS